MLAAASEERVVFRCTDVVKVRFSAKPGQTHHERDACEIRTFER